MVLLYNPCFDHPVNSTFSIFTLLHDTIDMPICEPSSTGFESKPPSNVIWEMNTLSELLRLTRVEGDVPDAALKTVFVLPISDTSDGIFTVDEKIYVPSLKRIVLLPSDTSASILSISAAATSPGTTPYDDAYIISTDALSRLLGKVMAVPSLRVI